MAEEQAHGVRAVYDHETDDPRLSRRRQVADWGVGDELFERMPRRRFRPSEPQRRDGHARRGSAARADEAPQRETRASEPSSTADVPSALDPLAPDAPTLVLELEEQGGARPPAVEAPRAELGALPLAGQGRRTVVIRGRGGEPARTRRRPPRSMGERVGPRPERLAAYAVALGVLLILIAVLTAQG